MTRTKSCHCDSVEFNPHSLRFEPDCKKAHASNLVFISLEELEAFRLRHLEDLDQKTSAVHMNTSVSSYQRLLDSASKKIADSIINCKTLSITKHS